MKPEEHKKYFQDEALMQQYFRFDNNMHGECKYFHGKNGKVWISTFFFQGDEHGRYTQYEENGDLFGYNFKYKGKLILGFPNLKQKPPRKPWIKSNRTRFETLEM